MNGAGPGCPDRAYLRIHYGEHIDFINVLPFHLRKKERMFELWSLL